MEYQDSVSHCVVEGTGLFVLQDGSSIRVEESEILELKTDTDWPAAAVDLTEMIVEGMVTKTNGSGRINLNTDYELIAHSGCVKPVSGAIQLGTEKGTL